jgi:hypothetical protein
LQTGDEGGRSGSGRSFFGGAKLREEWGGDGSGANGGEKGARIVVLFFFGGAGAWTWEALKNTGVEIWNSGNQERQARIRELHHAFQVFF